MSTARGHPSTSLRAEVGSAMPERRRALTPERSRRATSLLLLLLLVSCGPRVESGVTILATSETAALISDSIAFIGDARLHLVIAADPAKERTSRGGAVIALTTRGDCTECYRLDGDGTRLLVTGGAPLGLQYGLAHALEAFGYRFLHPWKTKLPDQFLTPDASLLGHDFAPAMTKRRGLHLHTLHPIEALYDLWVPGAANLEGAKRTIDFVIKNRGNYVQWCALDDITNSPAAAAAWQTHTRAIIDFAHARGVKVGAAIQLFGMSNLQNAFDLVDDTAGDTRPEMERRLHVLLDATPFDALNLSFGEFFGADPARFVTEVDLAYAAMQAVKPGVEVMATIHVGNYANLRVTYMNETQLYYFLVRYVNPAIVPWVHTTMYYNLYEDTGGAYLHEQFDEHRAYLEQRLAAGQPAGYFPESAYWIAFDNSLPTYLPLYVRSRHLDLANLAKVGTLEDHVLFSSGWEWGYWLNDVATLRMNFTRPAAWDEPVREVFRAWGEPGAKVADLVVRLGEVQHRALIEQRLAAYLAGRDQIIDVGDQRGIFSQPDRPELSELAAMTPAARADFVTRRLEPMRAFADDLTALEGELEALSLPADAWLDEQRDGFAITAARARYIHAIYAATVEYAQSGGDGGWLAKADAELDKAKVIVARRRNALWDPDPKSILRNNDNPTFYKYGYLREADSLCFWSRERAQARQLILQTGDTIPGCVL